MGWLHLAKNEDKVQGLVDAVLNPIFSPVTGGDFLNGLTFIYGKDVYETSKRRIFDILPYLLHGAETILRN